MDPANPPLPIAVDFDHIMGYPLNANGEPLGLGGAPYDRESLVRLRQQMLETDASPTTPPGAYAFAPRPDAAARAIPPDIDHDWSPPRIPRDSEAGDPRDQGSPAAEQPGNADGQEQDGQEDEQDDDDEDEDDGEEEGGEGDPRYPWYPIQEDESAPCEDEVKYIDSKEEHSALDHKYWAAETYFDLKDPEVRPGVDGRIDWAVNNFNGTKEKPNKELLMKSPVVHIGGYDWQIKLYPKGNRTDFLSVYVENLTVLDVKAFPATEALTDPPLPILSSMPVPTKRHSMAAQVGVIMYNPNEPRVHEFKSDAHQFHSLSADFGWKYFSREPRYEFHVRRHGQRQAMLRGDKLAFTAYIRILDDPTDCMFDRSFPSVDTSIYVSNVRPFESLSAQTAALVLLFHLRPFRHILYKHRSGDLLQFLQVCLEKIMSRRLKKKHLRNSPLPDGRDVVEIFQKIRMRLGKESSSEVASAFDKLFASLSPDQLPICSNRLKTADCSSVIEAVQKLPSQPHTPQILMMELERHRFDHLTRKWEKIKNTVALDDVVQVGGYDYQLYGFVTHGGALGSSDFTSYIRPHGCGTKWYSYQQNQVLAMTQKQAKPELRGPALPSKTAQLFDMSHRPAPTELRDENEVAYLTMYIRKDIWGHTFERVSAEKWDIPDKIRKSKSAPDAKAGGEKTKSPATSQDPEKMLESLVDVRGVEAIPEIQPLALPAPPMPLNVDDLMDGDDVVMSDAENDGSQTPIRFDRVSHGAGTVVHPSTSAARSSQASPQPSPYVHNPTIHHTIDFFGSEHYTGSVLINGLTPHGKGTKIDTNGDQYTGMFNHGMYMDEGSIIYAATGDTYTGLWAYNDHHGEGTYTEAASGNVYEGGWKEGRRHGKFVLRGEVTEEDKGRCQICYEGEMNTAFYDCGHVVACKECAARIDSCPVCRKRVVARVELFGVKVRVE
ncbi:hypothetical protein LTR95_014900 [Oleoguttula sp. CCFEE 5521]